MHINSSIALEAYIILYVYLNNQGTNAKSSSICKTFSNALSSNVTITPCNCSYPECAISQCSLSNLVLKRSHVNDGSTSSSFGLMNRNTYYLLIIC